MYSGYKGKVDQCIVWNNLDSTFKSPNYILTHLNYLLRLRLTTWTCNLMMKNNNCLLPQFYVVCTAMLTHFFICTGYVLRQTSSGKQSLPPYIIYWMCIFSVLNSTSSLKVASYKVETSTFIVQDNMKRKQLPILK